ncbi:MAG: DUF4037 domain-containing protein [Ktedonobacterales bacterium]
MAEQPTFVAGLDLSERFYTEAVRPILDAAFPSLAHAAALIGSGSEVLGFDTPRSADHNWGPRLQLFLRPDDHATHYAAISQTLAERLPRDFLGYSTNFTSPSDSGSRLMKPLSAPAAPAPTAPVPSDAEAPAAMQDERLFVRHFVEITTVDAFFRVHLGIAPTLTPRPLDWLLLPEQRLLSVTAGRVFHDGLGNGLGELNALRQTFAYYPHDVWLYLMSAQWRRIAQEEAFVGRTGEAGDELGSRIVAARLARDLMRLAFLQERRYAPYSKWLGTAFARLACGPELAPLLTEALRAESWQRREHALSQAYSIVARLHNALNVTAPLPTQVSPYYGRPFLVIHADRFADALHIAILDEMVLTLPFPIGSVDQWVDSTDALDRPALLTRLSAAYEG